MKLLRFESMVIDDENKVDKNVMKKDCRIFQVKKIDTKFVKN